MMIESKATIQLTDLSAIIFECKDCKTRMSVPCISFKDAPTKCPACEVQWLIRGSQAFVAIAEFVRLLRHCATTNGERFHIRFEVPQLKEVKT